MVWFSTISLKMVSLKAPLKIPLKSNFNDEVIFQLVRDDKKKPPLLHDGSDERCAGHKLLGLSLRITMHLLSAVSCLQRALAHR